MSASPTSARSHGLRTVLPQRVGSADQRSVLLVRRARGHHRRLGLRCSDTAIDAARPKIATMSIRDVLLRFLSARPYRNWYADGGLWVNGERRRRHGTTPRKVDDARCDGWHGRDGRVLTRRIGASRGSWSLICCTNRHAGQRQHLALGCFLRTKSAKVVMAGAHDRSTIRSSTLRGCQLGARTSVDGMPPAGRSVTFASGFTLAGSFTATLQRRITIAKISFASISAK
jgi:hypothetical protein